MPSGVQGLVSRALPSGVQGLVSRALPSGVQGLVSRALVLCVGTIALNPKPWGFGLGVTKALLLHELLSMLASYRGP